jgi:hypothetical protein
MTRDEARCSECGAVVPPRRAAKLLRWAAPLLCAGCAGDYTKPRKRRRPIPGISDPSGER